MRWICGQCKSLAFISRYNYAFDDIGNRETSAERHAAPVNYTANKLNQYTAIHDFTPTYDADGNQTTIKTKTGIWQVTYNGENRPIRWEQIADADGHRIVFNATIVTMTYDRIGRRVTKTTTQPDTNTTRAETFVYDGYLQVANQSTISNQTTQQFFIWDPTEPVATRPLVWNCDSKETAFYLHDGNKNVSEVVSASGEVLAHYTYAPFGDCTASGSSALSNPWRFSSEYADDELGCVYYNYRHYEPMMGQWLSRDALDVANQYAWCDNKSCDLVGIDVLGLTNEPGAFGWDNYSVEQQQCCNGRLYYPSTSCCREGTIFQRHIVYTGVSYFCMRARWWYQTIVTVRPFSTQQFALTHCWLNVNGNRFGAYPNGGLFKTKQDNNQSIQDDKDHAVDENTWYTSRIDIKLSPCQYNVDKFINCMNEKRNATWLWTVWNNCGDFVEDAVSDCMRKAAYDK